jgi:hypothetical protein
VDCLIDDVGADRARSVLTEVAERRDVDLHAGAGED